MVTNPALLEPYRSALTDRDLETCTIKLFTLTAELPQDYPQIPIETPPHLWILAAEVSDRLLKDFKAELDPSMGEGFYRCGKGWRTTIVALDELPNSPDTLWLRLMSKGRIQNDAIEELIVLRDTDPKRTNALNLLTSWRISMEITGQLSTEEEQTLMTWHCYYNLPDRNSLPISLPISRKNSPVISRTEETIVSAPADRKFAS